MKKGLNKVMIIGNVGNPPEAKYMPNGTAVAEFSVATSETWNDKQSGEKKEKTEWHKVVCYAKLAEIVVEYDFCAKGRKVYVEGSLETQKWQDSNGQDRYTTKIKAFDVQSLDSKAEGQHIGKQYHGHKADAYAPDAKERAIQQQEAQRMAEESFNDEIPF